MIISWLVDCHYWVAKKYKTNNAPMPRVTLEKGPVNPIPNNQNSSKFKKMAFLEEIDYFNDQKSRETNFKPVPAPLKHSLFSGILSLHC